MSTETVFNPTEREVEVQNNSRCCWESIFPRRTGGVDADGPGGRPPARRRSDLRSDWAVAGDVLPRTNSSATAPAAHDSTGAQRRRACRGA